MCDYDYLSVEEQDALLASIIEETIRVPEAFVCWILERSSTISTRYCYKEESTMR
jgi:hypothetical protein